jgi:hypothetical protein
MFPILSLRASLIFTGLKIQSFYEVARKERKPGIKIIRKAGKQEKKKAKHIRFQYNSLKFFIFG